MLCTVTVRVSAAHPDVPLREVPVFTGSACTVGVVDVPAYFGSVAITGVNVSISNAHDAEESVTATRCGTMWVATFQGDLFAAPGNVRNGLTVTASGTDEKGAARSWTLGKGDVSIMDAAGIPAPGEAWQTVHLRDEQPEKPVKGDLVRSGSAWKLYTGTEWAELGGGVKEDPERPGWAENAASADYATYAGSANHANMADTAERADTARRADSAGFADTAGHADSADSAGFAGSAGVAGYADTAGSATDARSAACDGEGAEIHTTYAKKEDVHNVQITINQGGVEKGRFTLNQDQGADINLDAGGGGAEMAVCVIDSRDSGSGGGSAELVVGKKSVWIGAGRCIATLPKKVGVKWTTGVGSIKNRVFLNGAEAQDGTEITLNDGDRITLEYGQCLEAHTLITMADGSTRQVCDLRDGDLVLSLDPDTLQQTADEVTGCDGGQVKLHNVTDVWTFDDGTVLKTVHPHEVYNVGTGRMEYLASFKLGDRVRKQDGSTPALVKHEAVPGVVLHNTLFTKRFNNYFAAGILAGNRSSTRWGWSWIERHGKGGGAA